MSRQFWVIAADGQSYGPADEATLAGWAKEGRLTAQSVLQDATSNQRVYASQVPSIATALTPTTAGHSAYQQPAGYQQQQTAVPMAGAYQQPVAQQGGYVQPVAYATPGAQGQVGHQLGSFSGALVIVLYFLTLGIFPFIHFMLMHGKLPKNRQDDPSAGKAIGFMFIPFFNLYWLFFAHLRLVDRINEQRRFAGLPDANLKGMFIAGICVSFVPFVGFVGAILMLVYMGQLQGAVNELVRATRGPTA